MHIVHPVYFVLLLLAAICFLLAVLNVPVRVNLLALGLLLWVLVPLAELAQG